MSEPLRILSLGAGVQSSTVLLLACRGEIALDAAIFADTQWEPAAVYRHLEWLEGEAAQAGIPVQRVTAGNIRTEALSKRGRIASMPLHLLNADGSKGQLRRQCTGEYKVRPIRRWIRNLMRERGQVRARLLFGISTDEAHRMRDSNVRYLVNEYPLVERRWSRQDCLAWMRREGYPEPPKSACIGCPFRGRRSWREMQHAAPAEFADAVAFDHAARSMPRIRGRVFLHASLIPLDQVDFRNERDHGQQDLFGEECEGMCGL